MTTTTTNSPNQSTVDAEIVAVTVYPDRARVTRRGSVTLAPGRHRVLVEPLPMHLHTDSIRVGGRGPAAVLGVDVVRRRHASSPDVDVTALTDQRRELTAKLAEIGDTDVVRHQRAEFLTALGQRSTVTFARTLAAGETDGVGVSAVADALESQLAEVYARRRELAVTRESVTAEIAAIDRRLSDLTGRAEPDRTAAAIDLEVTGDDEIALELSYLVDGGGWSSMYDLRLDGDRVAVTWYGLITQHTGEDWPECDLRLSTARPSRTAGVPELDPWFLDRARPVPPPAPYALSAAPGNAPRGRPTAVSAAPAQPQSAPIMDVVATVEQGVSAATYRTARPVAVPSDGATHRATVTAFELDAVLDYITAPVASPEAHLRATVANTSEHTLIKGRAAVFTGGDFVGNTQLATWAPGEEVELALGVDDRIRVEREVVGRKAAKATLGSGRRQEIGYRTTVTNHAGRQALVTVLDQIPVSRDENIVVRDVRLSPQPAERTDLGVLTWRCELEPGESVEIGVGVRVDLPKGVEMLGWRE